MYSVFLLNLEHSPQPGEIAEDVVKKATFLSWTWITVVVAFLAGVVIGELKIAKAGGASKDQRWIYYYCMMYTV